MVGVCDKASFIHSCSDQHNFLFPPLENFKDEGSCKERVLNTKPDGTDATNSD